jgi:hypothetical protein
MSEEIRCYNRGCGQKFKPEENTKDSCIYHPGPEYFHDAYKIWKCCDKKSTDFGTWLSFKGCTKGPHSNEKPRDSIRPAANKEIRPEKKEDVIVWNGLNKPAERTNGVHSRKSQTLRKEVHEAAIRAIERQKELQETAESSEATLVIGMPCKNNTCKATYNGPDSSAEPCVHHPGVAIFHEGMKYWSCCQIKRSDFGAFLEQQGCTTGEHRWIKNEKVDKIREDWFSRTGQIHINVYCRGALPEQCSFETDGLKLTAKVVHGFGSKDSDLDYDLWGEVDPSQSFVVIGERKVEMVLKQVGPEGWPKLRYDGEKRSEEASSE